MLKRLVVLALFVAPWLAAGAASAQAFVPGVDYGVVSPPQATDTPGKVEVTEFFWYGCPHCYDLEPTLEAWVKKLPRDVVFKRVPAAFNDQWAVAARVYYALEAIGESERLHMRLFNAVHRDRLRITSESEMADWLKRQNVDVDKYTAAYRSFAVESKLRRANQQVLAYKIDGVPTLIVQGRYLVSGTMAGSRQRMFDITDYLIGLARKDLGKR